VTLHLGDPFAAGRRQRGHRVEQAATVTDADHQRQHAAGPTGGSRAACHLSDAIFTHPFLAEGLNTLFAMFDAEGGALSRR
jgi:hypothetical protein